MKHLVTAFLILCFAFSMSAQSKIDEKVQERTDELELVLALNKKEKKKVHAILLEKEQKIVALRKTHKGDKETLKAEIKKLHPAYNGKLRAVLGKERMQQFIAYLQEKRKK